MTDRTTLELLNEQLKEELSEKDKEINWKEVNKMTGQTNSDKELGKCPLCNKFIDKKYMKAVSTGIFCSNSCAFHSLKTTAENIAKEMGKIAPIEYELTRKFEIKPKFKSLLGEQDDN